MNVIKTTFLLALSASIVSSCSQEAKARTAEQKSSEGNDTLHAQYCGLQTGDIIFQTSLSRQALAIQMATNSDYSHVGMVFIQNNDTIVLEAVQPVKFTPFRTFVSHGKFDTYEVKRLKDNSSIIDDQIEFINLSKQYLGKNYDLKFTWGDDKMYCSELVYRMYERGLGIVLCDKKPLKSYHLDGDIVKDKLKERYGNKIPWEELMVSPEDIFQSEKLVTVDVFCN